MVSMTSISKSVSKSLDLVKIKTKLPKVLNNLVLRRNQSVYSEEYIRPHMTRLGLDDNSLQITSFNQFGFSINSRIKALGPIIIFPKTIFSWNIDDIKDVNEKSLSIFKLIQPRVDVLIIGVGDKYEKISPNVPKWLIQNNIRNFEILPTEKAVSTFNFLVGDSRFVGAALLPSIVFNEPEMEAKLVHERANLYKENEFPTEQRNKRIAEKLKDYDRTQKTS